MSFRDIKRAGRRQLHATMAVPALYFPMRGATPVPCTVRVHTKFAALGQLNGSSGDAERAEADPRIIFLKSEVPAPRPQTGIVSVEPGEAYSIVAADPADDITVTAKVTRLSATMAAGLPTPIDLSVQPPVVITPVGVFDLSGGETGDVLTKASGDDYDFTWTARTFVFQQATPLMLWEVDHNLGRMPLVTVNDLAGNEVEAEVTNTSINHTDIRFTVPQSGIARFT